VVKDPEEVGGPEDAEGREGSRPDHPPEGAGEDLPATPENTEASRKEDADGAPPDPEDAATPPDKKPALTRSLGFWEALTIGTGTMVGAGIFLFPGLAGGEAGMAAALSFALGAGVAILVALPASELASAMPRSGGGYQFVSRSLGALPGSLVGIGQWAGLVFASAFYLAGFGEYLRELLEELQLGPVPDSRWLAFGATLLLTGVAMVGTRHAGKLQDSVVGILLLLLGAFLTYGLVELLVLGGGPALPEDFAPRGFAAVFPTAALIFTSYLGFIQITTVAGDIKKPARNIPRAMLGSIGLVAVLYLLTIFLTTSVLEADRLRELGGTALTEVARSLLGVMGALVVFAAGLLATLSSANASILGSSRSLFALASDSLIPDGMSRVNRAFGTPVRSLALAGGPVAGLVLFGRLEILAEVASILHLVMYGLICFALLYFRWKLPDGYQPGFRAPGHPVLPALGGVASFALIAWMEYHALLIGGIVLLAATAWHFLYAPEVRLRGKLR